MEDISSSGGLLEIIHKLEPYQKLIALQLVCTSLFIVCYVEDASVMFLEIRMTTGALALIILPEATITAAMVPEFLGNIWVSIFMGAILTIIQIQVLFSLARFILLQGPPMPWLPVTSTIIVLTEAELGQLSHANKQRVVNGSSLQSTVGSIDEIYNRTKS